jgi:hypothetical protein
MPLTANSSGVLTGSFTIPPNVTAGIKRVEFHGAGGSFAGANYTGTGEIIVRRWSRTTTIVNQVFDPLAQTFQLNRPRHITGVDLKFTIKGGSGEPVLVQIRETSNGVPTQEILADGRIEYSQINTEAPWVRANFETPVFLEEDREYAIVVLTNDADHSVAVAELGQFDNVNQTWVTSQPYVVGVLLASSNAITWTPFQERDLTFRLIGARFSSNTRTINLGSLQADNASDLLAVAPIDQPTAQTDVALRFTVPGGEQFTLRPGEGVPLPELKTGNVQVDAVLTGNELESPVLFPGSQAGLGAVQQTGTYVSRAIPVGTSKTVRVIFSAITPGNSTVTPALQDGGGTFINLTNPTGVPLGDGWIEYSYTSSQLTQTDTRVRLSLAGNTAGRPRVRGLRVVVL